MFKVITEDQKREIEGLAAEHSDALIAFGADLYRTGLIKGAIYAVAGVCVGNCLVWGVKEIKKHKTQNGEEA